jgi:hypothetical protein
MAKKKVGDQDIDALQKAVEESIKKALNDKSVQDAIRRVVAEFTQKSTTQPFFKKIRKKKIATKKSAKQKTGRLSKGEVKFERNRIGDIHASGDKGSWRPKRRDFGPGPGH